MEPQQICSPPAPPGTDGASAFWFIGSSDECAFRTGSGPGQVAILLRRDSRLFVLDLGSGQCVLVNQSPLARGAEMELTRYDQLEVAGVIIEIEPRLFLGGTQLGIDTTALFLPRPDGRPGWLCERAFLRARPGSFTAILGPAGSGKTVFLSLLNGYTRPSQGRIVVGQSYDLHTDAELLRSCLGYVPQHDVMVPELTVRQSLDFRLLLRFPDMAPGVRERLIRQTCTRLGFHSGRLEVYLDTMIGLAELGCRGLSGGERRFANIAHELVMKPAVLLLDEPTSGLASIDAEQVVGLLKALAREEHLTLVATVHQPSRESFACFDDLMVMSHGGRVAYYGPADKAVAFFQRATEEPFAPTENPAEYVLRHLDEPSRADHVVRYYAQQGHELPRPLSGAPQPADLGRPRLRQARRVGRFQRLGENFRTLLRRNLAVTLADRFNLWLALGQVPLMAALIWLAFLYFPDDAPGLEAFNRSLYHFSRNKEPYLQSNGSGGQRVQTRPMRVESLFERAQKQALTDGWMISPQMAQRRGAVYFVLIAAAVWLGIVSGCREIVVEKHVLQREARTCVRLTPYLSAKLGGQMILAAIQCAILTLLVVPWLLHVPPFKQVGVWLALWVTAGAACSAGLMISAIAPSYRAALTAVPLVLIPQLLFGGLLRPIVEMAPAAGLSRVAGWLTFQRWGFESALAMDPYAANGVMRQEFSPGATENTDAYQFVRDLEFKDAPLASVFFGENPGRLGFGWPLLILTAEAAAFLGLSRWFLMRCLGLKARSVAKSVECR